MLVAYGEGSGEIIRVGRGVATYENVCIKSLHLPRPLCCERRREKVEERGRKRGRERGKGEGKGEGKGKGKRKERREGKREGR